MKSCHLVWIQGIGLGGVIVRIGMGYDIHRLVPERRLILGGIEIPHDKGLAGHSDADVLIHAVCDALLGAAGLGDIGLHFPDTDPQYKDISSIILLDRTLGMIIQKGYSIVNVDTTIFAQSPRLSPFREAMQQKLSEALNIEPGDINIKATTTEGLGMIGSNEGIGSMAVVLLT
jgi:2-C-methyl-D-erythritol 2,4-cyclodiphosphate synthase